MSDIVLRTTRLTKEFSGFTAVGGIDLQVRRGDIHALIGPNGAGKTTLFNLLTKFLKPTSGRIEFNGADITGLPPPRVAALGLVRSFQVSAVFGGFTALENVRVALQRRAGPVHDFWSSSRVLARLDTRAWELLELVQLQADAHTLAAFMPYGKKRVLELATTIAAEPEVMLLDEPTQGMGHEDVGRITALIRKLAAGRTVVMVEHNMKVVAGICDTVTVLQRGEVLAEGPYEQVSRDARVLQAYLGIDPADADQEAA